jgi:AcrR family transcriptional regulator
MILAAERLFAEKGIQSVSLREILSVSGQRNSSAANYHFGNKRGLIYAIFEYRMGPIDARRQAMLAELDEQGRGNQLRDVLAALVVPVAEFIGAQDGLSWYARFAAQVTLDSTFDPLAAPYDRVSRGLAGVVGRLNSHLSHVPAKLRPIRVQAVLGLFGQVFADHETRLSRDEPTPPTKLLAANAIDVLEAVISAPVSPETARQAGASRSRSGR